jgi:DNA-binding protein Alba
MDNKTTEELAITEPENSEENKVEDTSQLKKSGYKTRAAENVIFVGGKPFMNYVTGVVMQFTTKNSPKVIVSARGRFIAKAVDVAEVSAKRFLQAQKITVENVKIDSADFKNDEGKEIHVSTIDIILKKS